MVKRVLFFFIAWRALTLLFAYIATFVIPLNLTFTLPFRYRFEFINPDFTGFKPPQFLWIWANFDGFYYLGIAERGYFSNEEPFFPLYPFLINLFSSSGIPHLVSALSVSHITFFLSLLVLGKLLFVDKKESLLNTIYIVIILFPTALFYGAVYNDSLFFLLSTVSLYFARKRLWLGSSFAAGFATLTRLNGLALVFPILLEYLFKDEKDVFLAIKRLPDVVQKSFSLKQIKKSKIFAVLLVPSAFFAYLFYIQMARGNWNLVFSSMAVWNQDKITFPLQVAWRYFKIIFLYPTFQLNYWIAVFEAVTVALYVFAAIYSFKKIRLSYWIFFVISILIPTLTGTFQGMPRYGLHLYPFFLILALFLENRRRWLKFIYFIISTILLGISTMLFTRGYFVA